RPIIEKEALAWAVGIVGNVEIDEINILNASFKAMHLAVNQLKIKPEFLLIDGNRFKPYPEIPHACVVKGDGKYLSIAAASSLPKTYRDALMARMAREYPGSGRERNDGSPTPQHRAGMRRLAVSPRPRTSFT